MDFCQALLFNAQYRKITYILNILFDPLLRTEYINSLLTYECFARDVPDKGCHMSYVTASDGGILWATAHCAQFSRKLALHCRRCWQTVPF